MIGWRIACWWRRTWCGIKGHDWTRWFDLAYDQQGRACEGCGKVRYRKRPKGAKT